MTFRHSQLQNFVQSVLLLTGMLSLMAFTGYVLAGLTGLFILLVSALLVLLSIPRFSSRLITLIYGAQQVNRQQLPVVYDLLQVLSHRAGLVTMPGLYYLPAPRMLAFSIGMKGDEAIVLSEAMLRKLNTRELSAVLAHEISHICNKDIYVMVLADVISRFTALLALMGYLMIMFYLPLILFSEQGMPWLLILILILAPNISAIMQLALSRTREFSADYNAAQLTCDPDGLVSALNKIEYYQGHWLESILMPGRRQSGLALLRTHPATRDRINRLLMLKADIESSYETDDSRMLDLSQFKSYHHRPERGLFRSWFR